MKKIFTIFIIFCLVFEFCFCGYWIYNKFFKQEIVEEQTVTPSIVLNETEIYI